MCDESGTPTEAASTLPREANGTAVDPITLEPVDEVVITTLVDNSYDALMGDTGPARRRSFAQLPAVAAPQFEEGRTSAGLIAEHGFSDLAPDVPVPAHCTGWKAQHRLAAALPGAFIPNAVGTSYTLAA